MKTASFLLALLLFVTLALSIQINQTINVQAMTIKNVTVSLALGETLNGSYTTKNGFGSGIHFMIKDPDGAVIVDNGKDSTEGQFTFLVTSAGQYEIVLENKDSLTESVNVDLSYEVGKLPEIQEQNPGLCPGAVVLLLSVLAVVAMARVNNLGAPRA